MPAVDVAEITMSNAILYYAPLGTALPADSLAVGGVWPVGWQRIGLSSAPLTVAYSFETKAPEIQEAMGTVKSKKISEEATLETMMAQLNLTVLSNVWGGSTTLTPAGAGQPAKEQFKIGGAAQMPLRLWGFEGEQENDAGLVFPVRGFIYRGTGDEGGDLEYSKEDYTGIPLKIIAHEDMTKPKGERLLTWYRITAPATV
jgi:hypothetical protein